MTPFTGSLSHNGSKSEVEGRIGRSDPKRPDSLVGDFYSEDLPAFGPNDRPMLTIREGEISGFKLPISVRKIRIVGGRSEFSFHSSGKGKPLLVDHQAPEGRGIEGR